MKIGFIGLGNMGRNMALRIQESEKLEVIGWNRSQPNRDQSRDEGLHVVDSVADLVDELSDQSRKVVFLMVSAGDAVDQVIFAEGGLAGLLSAGDIIIDGANSHFEGTKSRAAKLQEQGITLLDAGISGGVEKARTGASMMVGGDRATFEYVQDLFAALATENGYGYFGPSGAGHFVKMVHNGIEYGMMQAIGEGLNIINSSEYDVDLAALTKVWNHGSIIQSNLIGFINQALASDGKLDSTSAEIGSLGTGKWTVDQALKQGVPANAIAAAVFARYESRGTSEFIAKVVQAMRAEFGAHTSSERPT